MQLSSITCHNKMSEGQSYTLFAPYKPATPDTACVTSQLSEVTEALQMLQESGGMSMDMELSTCTGELSHSSLLDSS